MISSDVAGGDEATRPGPIGIVVSSGPPRASVPDVRGVDVDAAVARLDGSFDTSVVEEGSETAAAGTVLRQSPDPGTRAVLGSTVTLTVARAPEWGTTWSRQRQRLLRLGGHRGHRSAGQVADRRRPASALPDLRLRLGDRVVGGHRSGQHLARLRRLGRGRAPERRRHLSDPRAPAGQRQLDRAARTARLAAAASRLGPCVASASSVVPPRGTIPATRRLPASSGARSRRGRSSSSPAAARSA